MLLVIKTNTVVDPGTVMIHSENTMTTNRAMVRSECLHTFTFLAILGDLFLYHFIFSQGNA